MKCLRCNGRKYIELDKVGLLVTDCPECKGTGLIDATPPQGQVLVDFAGGDGEKATPPQRPDNLAPGLFWCSKCNAPHREGSKPGQRHLKFKIEV